MGKKSRLKRERRSGLSNLLGKTSGNWHDESNNNEADFLRRSEDLFELFSQFNAEDVLVALGISDLWIPNISSQIKHYFVLGVAMSMKLERFTSSNRLNTYVAFREFARATYKLLPSFS